VSNVWARLWRKKNDDERGAILIISTVGIVLAVVAAALAVDLGTLSQQRRRDQKIADLAALDAVRDFANMQARAEESALRNGFPVGTAGHSITAIEGKKVGGNCQPVSGSGTVCVTVNSPHKNSFLPGGNAVAARAVAGLQNEAGFTMGSSLASASLDDATENLPLLNRVFGRFLGGPTGQATVLSYQGLANSNVKWRDLQAALGFGTVNEMLTADITMGELLDATATVLNNQGVTSYDVYTDVIRLRDSTTNQQKFKLGEMFSIASGYENKILDSDINVLQLITGGAEVANKNTFIDAGYVINLPVNLPAPLNTTANVNTKLGIKVIEGPKWYRGPEGLPIPPLKTSQMEITLTPHIDIDFTSPLYNLLGLLEIGVANLQLVGDMPIKFTAAGALGFLEDVRCSAPGQGITVDITSLPITTSVDGSLGVYLSTIVDFVTGNVKVGVELNPSDVSTTTGGPYDVIFNYPNDFTPPDPDGQTTPGAPAGVTMTTTNVHTTVGAAGLTQVVGLVTGTLKIDVVESAIVGPILNPVFNAVANHLTTPALKALGVSLGPVNVTAPTGWFDPAACGQPGLLQ
jgi:uncharacterized membrane protein